MKTDASRSDPILSPVFLFRFSIPCRYQSQLWTADGIQFSEQHMIPCFGELEGRRLFAEVRAGWNESGIGFTARVVGKQQPVWCRTTRMEDSDGLHLWIDTRNAKSIHRATRFCHRFAFLPAGSGRGLTDPAAEMLQIAMAKEYPKAVSPDRLKVAKTKTDDGYELSAYIPAESLTGFSPEDHPEIGFFYAVADRELGWQTLSIDREYPIDRDPSLWGTLELTR